MKKEKKVQILLKSCLGQFCLSIIANIPKCISLEKSQVLTNSQLNKIYSFYSLPNLFVPFIFSIFLEKASNKNYQTQKLSICLFVLTFISSCIFLLGVLYNSFFFMCVSQLVLGICDSYSVFQNFLLTQVFDKSVYGVIFGIFYGMGRVGSFVLYMLVYFIIKDVYWISSISVVLSLIGLVLEVFCLRYFSIEKDDLLRFDEEKTQIIETIKEKEEIKKIKIIKNNNLARKIFNFMKRLKIFIKEMIRNEEKYCEKTNENKKVITLKDKKQSKKNNRYFLILIFISFLNTSVSSFLYISPVLFSTQKQSSISLKSLAYIEIYSLIINLTVNFLNDLSQKQENMLVIGSTINTITHSLIYFNKISLNTNKSFIFFLISSSMINSFWIILPQIYKEDLPKKLSTLSCVSNFSSVVIPFFINIILKKDECFIKVEEFYLSISTLLLSFCLIFKFVL